MTSELDPADVGTEATGPPGTVADTLGLLSEAVLSYLEELDADRLVCLRHEATADVTDSPEGLGVALTLPQSDDSAGQIRRSAGHLPGWDDSPWWGTLGEEWTRLLDAARQAGRKETSSPGFARGFLWEGRPVLVITRVAPDDALCLELLLPALPDGLPDLALRLLARALRCQEYLLSGQAGELLARREPSASRGLSPRQYLARATQRNLCASQCILGQTEEQ